MTSTNEPTHSNHELLESHRRQADTIAMLRFELAGATAALTDANVQIDALKKAIDVVEQMEGNSWLVSADDDKHVNSATYQTNGDGIDVEFARYMWLGGKHYGQSGGYVHFSQDELVKLVNEEIEEWKARKANDNG